MRSFDPVFHLAAFLCLYLIHTRFFSPCPSASNWGWLKKKENDGHNSPTLCPHLPRVLFQHLPRDCVIINRLKKKSNQIKKNNSVVNFKVKYNWTALGQWFLFFLILFFLGHAFENHWCRRFTEHFECQPPYKYRHFRTMDKPRLLSHALNSVSYLMKRPI